MENYTIEGIGESTNVHSDGTPMTTPDGKSLWRVALGIKEVQGKHLVCYSPFEPNDNWIGRTAVWVYLSETLGPDGDIALGVRKIPDRHMVIVPSLITSAEDLKKIFNMGYVPHSDSSEDE